MSASNNNLFLNSEDISKALNCSWQNYSPCSFSSVITDTRKSVINSLFIAIEGENFDGHDFLEQAVLAGAFGLCISKYKLEKIPFFLRNKVPYILVENTTKAYQDIANYHRLRLKNTCFIGITGSNGKTSTKDILSCILKNKYSEKHIYSTQANTNNHIGVPLNILNVRELHRFAIIELGSNHPGEISLLTSILKPDIAVITSIGPSHLEFLKDLDGVAKEKGSIFSNFNQCSKNISIYPDECHGVSQIKSMMPPSVRQLSFGFNKSADTQIKSLNNEINGFDFELKFRNKNGTIKCRVPLAGKHQAVNAAAAATVAVNIGIKPDELNVLLKNVSVTGMRMRLEKHNGVSWINDAYNANSASVLAGIDYLNEISNKYKTSNIYAVLGNMLELGEQSEHEHCKIINYAEKSMNNITFLCHGEMIEKAASNSKKKSIIKFSSKEEIVAFLKKRLAADDIVYLKASRGAKFEDILLNFK